MDEVRLTQITCATDWGETVMVLGSCPALGNWQPSGAVPLRTTEDSYPVWTSEPVLLTALPGETFVGWPTTEHAGV